MSKKHSQADTIHKAMHITGTDPAVTYPTRMQAEVLWLDTSTTPDTLKKRNAGNTDWDVLGYILDANTAGNGLAHSSGVLSVGVDGSTIEINSDALRVKAAGILASHIGDAELAALAGLTSAADKIPYFTGSGTADLLTRDTDTSLAANSDTRLATQKAVKTYVDGIVTGGASDVMIFKGVLDCSANPNYPAADAGHLYKVSVAGKIGGGSGPNVEAGDTLYCITDSTASGTHAGVGANWVIAQVNVDGAYFAGGTDVAVADGGTGASDASGARTNLGLAIGSNVQAYNADLADIAALTPSNDDVLQRKAGAWTNRTQAQLAADLKAQLPIAILIGVTDETTVIVAGTGKISFRMPYAFTLSAVRASLVTAASSGTFTVDINENGSTILSTKLTFDATEKTTTTAATPAVISDTGLADDAEITIDVDDAGGGSPAGLKVTLIGVRA